MALHGVYRAVMGWPTPSVNPWGMRESKNSCMIIWSIRIYAYIFGPSTNNNTP